MVMGVPGWEALFSDINKLFVLLCLLLSRYIIGGGKQIWRTAFRKVPCNSRKARGSAGPPLPMISPRYYISPPMYLELRSSLFLV